jgi:hypothetical protein
VDGAKGVVSSKRRPARGRADARDDAVGVEAGPKRSRNQLGAVEAPHLIGPGGVAEPVDAASVASHQLGACKPTSSRTAARAT